MIKIEKREKEKCEGVSGKHPQTQRNKMEGLWGSPVGVPGPKGPGDLCARPGGSQRWPFQITFPFHRLFNLASFGSV